MGQAFKTIKATNSDSRKMNRAIEIKDTGRKTALGN